MEQKTRSSRSWSRACRRCWRRDRSWRRGILKTLEFPAMESEDDSRPLEVIILFLFVVLVLVLIH